MPSGGVRELTILTEFTPFGLTAEALDGSNHSEDDYNYFLFDSQLAQQRDDADDEIDDASALCSEASDHELFIRRNRIIWSTGPRVYKRFTLTSKVIKVCWCRMGDMSEALICVLQLDRLTIYGIAGEMVSIPLPHAMTSIWPLPFGLLLQRAPEGSLLTNISLSSSNPYLSARDVFRQKRDVGYSPQHNYTSPHIFDISTRSDRTSSHMILKDPLEDPQITYIEERGKLNLMWEFDERTIWTGDCIPLIASYNKGKMQHSLWVVEVNNSNFKVANPKSSGMIAPGMLAKHFFRRIWQGKVSQTAASKVCSLVFSVDAF